MLYLFCHTAFSLRQWAMHSCNSHFKRLYALYLVKVCGVLFHAEMDSSTVLIHFHLFILVSTNEKGKCSHHSLYQKTQNWLFRKKCGPIYRHSPDSHLYGNGSWSSWVYFPHRLVKCHEMSTLLIASLLQKLCSTSVSV